MIDLPIALALKLRWREPREADRILRARRFAVAARRLARKWRRVSSEEWLMRFEQPPGRPDPRI
jgi:hypothetical protein